jgi:hypothetical protein
VAVGVARALWLALVLWALGSGMARAHDLVVDELLLFPRAGELRGQLTLDPELTRGLDVTPTAATEAQLMALLARELRIEVDGKTVVLAFSLREFWQRGGATPGDVVMLSGALPSACGSLRVYAGTALKLLAVSVEAAQPGGATDVQSWLLPGGTWTPEYRCEPGAGSAWREGGLERLLPELEDARSKGASADGAASSEPAPRAALGWRAVWAFLRLGFLHIVPEGLDHMLFVTGLVLGAAGRPRRVLLELSAFTLAHTITLALSSLDVVCLPSHIVEPLIALSIAYVGFENLRARHAPRARVLLVFAFGLMHGLGFASALAGAHAGGGFLVALVAFNVGVELGQVAVVLPVFFALRWLASNVAVQRLVVRWGSLAIAAAGVFWAIQRVFWGD